MKKILSSIIILLFLNINLVIANDDIYYCSDDIVTGIEDNEIRKFNPLRFKAKINLDKGVFEPEKITAFKWKRGGDKNTFTDGVFSIIKFDIFKNYERAVVGAGMSSSVIAKGSCSKF